MTRPNSAIVWPAAMLVLATVVAPAAAQSPRVEIAANVGVLGAISPFEESQSFPSNGNETATVTVDHRVKTPLAFSVGGAVRIFRQVWAGVQYARADMKSGASVTASIPHPLLFNAPRTVEGSIDHVAHKESNLHVDLMYGLPAGALDVKVMAGPTFFNLEQDFVSDVAINETYPFDAATFASATTRQLSKSAVGFNAGVDVSYPLSSWLGIGGLIRYSRAELKFGDAELDQQTVRAGGVEAVGGVRIRF